jgi:hypoxanthine-guanine phosphoribosyltransferase
MLGSFFCMWITFFDNGLPIIYNLYMVDKNYKKLIQDHMQKISKEEILVWATIAGTVLFISYLMHTINVLLDLVLSCQS